MEMDTLKHNSPTPHAVTSRAFGGWVGTHRKAPRTEPSETKQFNKLKQKA